MLDRHVRTTLRKTPAARCVVASWRELTGHNRTKGVTSPTLVACSGGADSCALALALWSAKVPIIIAHIVHDMRPHEQAIADRDAAARLAAMLGAPFTEGSASGLRTSGHNIEAAARRARYRELGRIAAARGCEFIATAHHADDQAETLLLRLLRGSGMRGLAGIRARIIRVDHAIIRPMLGITREQSEDLCAHAGWAYQTDSTNADGARARGWLRREISPRLEARFPGWAARVAPLAGDLALAAAQLAARVEVIWNIADTTPIGRRWSRADLRSADRLTLAELLLLCSQRFAEGRGLDRVSRQAQARVIRAIMDDATHPRTLQLGVLHVRVTAKHVEIEPGPA